jgi:hypothetical protein
VHGGFVRQASTGAGLVKRSYQGLLLQQIAVAAVHGNRLQLFSDLKNPEKLIALELFERKDITT